MRVATISNAAYSIMKVLGYKQAYYKIVRMIIVKTLLNVQKMLPIMSKNVKYGYLWGSKPIKRINFAALQQNNCVVIYCIYKLAYNVFLQKKLLKLLKDYFKE